MSRLAHVSYVIPQEVAKDVAGGDPSMLMEPFSSPLYVSLMLITVFAVVVSYYVLTTWSVSAQKIRYFRAKARTYTELIPWMLRIALGISFIGAGSAGHLLSPAIDAPATIAGIEILLGFLLLTGALLTPTVIIAFGLSMGAILIHPTLIGNLEIPAALLAFLLLGNAKPGIDDLIGINLPQPDERLKALAPLILRVGIGGAMMYLAVVEKFLNPHMSAAVVTIFDLQNIIPVSLGMWVVSAGIIEFIVGLCLFVGFHTRFTAAIAFFVLTATFFFFGEDVAAHVTLFGVLSVLMITSGSYGSIDSYLSKRNA